VIFRREGNARAQNSKIRTRDRNRCSARNRISGRSAITSNGGEAKTRDSFSRFTRLRAADRSSKAVDSSGSRARRSRCSVLSNVGFYRGARSQARAL
jgi:hypothetical protein